MTTVSKKIWFVNSLIEILTNLIMLQFSQNAWNVVKLAFSTDTNAETQTAGYSRYECWNTNSRIQPMLILRLNFRLYTHSLIKKINYLNTFQKCLVHKETTFFNENVQIIIVLCQNTNCPSLMITLCSALSTAHTTLTAHNPTRCLQVLSTAKEQGA